MPDEEGDDLWVDPTQGLAPNATCPISGKDLLSLNDPVKCVACRLPNNKSTVR